MTPSFQLKECNKLDLIRKPAIRLNLQTVASYIDVLYYLVNYNGHHHAAIYFASTALPYWRAISMLLVLANAVSLHWSANMLLINWKVLSSIPSEGMLACCCCVVKCWYAILK